MQREHVSEVYTHPTNRLCVKRVLVKILNKKLMLLGGMPKEPEACPESRRHTRNPVTERHAESSVATQTHLSALGGGVVVSTGWRAGVKVALVAGIVVSTGCGAGVEVAMGGGVVVSTGCGVLGVC